MPGLRFRVWLLVMAGVCACYARAGTVAVSGRSVTVDGQPFLMKGVCYAPNPIGHSGEQAPNGDFFTIDWRPVYARDLPLMRDMGVNCVRVYGWSPTANHDDFLDLAWNRGHRPIHVLINRWVDPGTDWNSPDAVSALRGDWAGIATNAMHHPATLGYVIGNELNGAVWNPSLGSLWTGLDAVAGEIRRHDTNHLVTTALSDNGLIGTIAAWNAGMTNFNAWCVQVYRGDSFKTLFTDYAAASGKPLFVTEFGLDAYDARTGGEYPDNAAVQGAWLLKLWNELAANSPVASGGAVFEWCDEWWKAGNSSLHNAGGWANGAFPDGQADEEWWGLHRVAAGSPNVLSPRAAYEVLRGEWWVASPAATLAIDRIAGTAAPRIGVNGPPGFAQVLEVSDTLKTWTALRTNAAPFVWMDTNAPGTGRRFFRALALP